MEVIYAKDGIKLIEHDRSRHSYEESNGEIFEYQLKETLFDNFKRKQKTKTSEERDEFAKIKTFLQECKLRNLFASYSDSEIEKMKSENCALIDEFYKVSSNDFGELRGENNTARGRISTTDGTSYLIPPACRLFNKNVMEIDKFLPQTEKFDFIVIDPPWKCRYIKRLRKTCDKKSYSTMSNEEISNIPLRNYTHDSTIVIVWCTNSETHENFIKDTLLAKWDLKLTAVWHWLKVDKTGDTFCSFDGSKKPYEKIFIATRSKNENVEEGIVEKEISIVSQPSSIHSHKPPLLNLFRHVMPAQPKCLELFARSLYENFTSIGTEVLKLQNTLLYEKVSSDSPDRSS